MLDETWWNTVPHLSVNFNKYALVIWLHFVILLQKNDQELVDNSGL